MAQQANITIKKKDGTTDVVWTGMTGSAGDGVEAEWQNLTVVAPPAYRPSLKVTGRKGGTNGMRRKARAVMLWPVTAVVDGVTVMVDSIKVVIESDVSMTLDTVVTEEAVYQALNLGAAAHMKVQMSEGRAST